ncbi:BRO family protein [Brevibacterium luteolum]|uniref:Bro-N domain-containing protein n=1 Tax=Brevibacterium luteolum TaxID=199591 RepID=A0A2N6PIH4_9MICO|nr:BRO family protein [Brevibacterium luteolum]PMB98476.1 hypothetical protein CJ198_03810 [Brevibacterium luteolum]
MNNLRIFDYQDTPVRTVELDGEPWFVLADLAKVLGIASPGRLAARLDEGVRQTHTLGTAGGAQQMTIVSEAGMYEVVIRSDKPEAVEFRRWITAEVLPAIRKTGRYQANPLAAPELVSRADLARMVLEAEEEKKVLEAAIESQAPIVAYHERFVAESDDIVTVDNFAGQYNTTGPQVRELLHEKRIAVRRCIGRRWSKTKQRMVDDFEWRPRAGVPSAEWFELRPQHNAPRLHNGQVRQTMYVRQFYAADLAARIGLQQPTLEAQS